MSISSKPLMSYASRFTSPSMSSSSSSSFYFLFSSLYLSVDFVSMFMKRNSSLSISKTDPSLSSDKLLSSLE
jgi:hypothetical protein